MIRRLIPVFLTLALAAACAQQDGKDSSKQAKAKESKTQAAGPAGVAVPKGAVEIEPGLWRYVDEKGKAWNYRRTPFGLAKYEPEADAAGSADNPDLVATEDGDSVRFERRTPFGVSRWTKKKSELNSEEKAAWERVSAPPKAEPQKVDAKSGDKE